MRIDMNIKFSALGDVARLSSAAHNNKLPNIVRYLRALNQRNGYIRHRAKHSNSNRFAGVEQPLSQKIYRMYRIFSSHRFRQLSSL